MAVKRIVVVGGGAAGIIAAWRAASLGAKVTLLEKTPRLGTKILISGGGKCNICHDGPIEDVLRAFRKNEALFLRPSVYRFPNTAILEIFTSNGLQVYTRPDGRVFPVRQTAKDVVAILRSELEKAGVEICLETAVQSVNFSGGIINSVGTAEKDFEADSFIISTGGSSYPNSGTTGDGWKWAREIGHSIVPIKAALAPVYLELISSSPESNLKSQTELSISDLSGISLREIVTKARCEGKEISRWGGDLLFTHHGISGPCALGISREIAEHLGAKPVSVEVDLRPEASSEMVDDELLKWVHANPKKQIGTYFDAILPTKTAQKFLNDGGVESGILASNLPKTERKRLATQMKAWKLGSVRAVPLEKGECVAGGISLDEVNSKTMQSSKCSNLFLCGEVLDIAGPVGGYNLQAAFATGFVAGESASLHAS